MTKKLIIGIALVVLCPLAGWLCLTWLFTSFDQFDRIFASGSPAERATNILSLLFSAAGAFVSAVLFLGGVTTTVEALSDREKS